MPKKLVFVLKKLKYLEPYLKSKLYGQNDVIEEWCSIVKRAYTLSDPKLPRAVSFLLGPTGSGKTEIIKLTSRFLYGKNNNLIKLDMSEYSKLAGDDVMKKLIGAPNEGYGQLGHALEGKNEGFILYDEFEKAHKDLFPIMLQQLDEARITLGGHKTMDLSNFIIVLTSNVTANMFQSAKYMTIRQQREAALDTLRMQFSPEFIGRFGDNIFTFKRLERKHMKHVAQKFIDEESNRLRKQGIIIEEIEPEFLTLCIKKGSDIKTGARNMRQTVSSFIQNAVISALEFEKYPHGTLSVQDGIPVLKTEKNLEIHPDEHESFESKYEDTESVKILIEGLKR